MKTKRVLLDYELAPKILDLFDQARIEADVIKPKPGSLETLVKHGHYCALIFQGKTRIPVNVMQAAGKSLKVIGVVGDNLNNLNVIDASNNGILIKVTEYGNTYEVANLAKRLILYMVSRSFRENDTGQAHIFSRVTDIVPSNCSGFELGDRTLGLIGCGNVAQALALDIHPYCDKVLGYDKYPRIVYEQFHQRAPLEKPVIDYCQLHNVIERADIISVHTSGDQKVLCDRDLVISKKKPYVINTAISGGIDEKVLFKALKEKRIRGAALTLSQEQLQNGSLPDQIQPFLALKNVVIAPSVGKPTADAHKKNSRKLAQSVIDYLVDKDLSLAVNPMDIHAGKRKKRYPIYRGSRQASVPMHFG